MPASVNKQKATKPTSPRFLVGGLVRFGPPGINLYTIEEVVTHVWVVVGRQQGEFSSLQFYSLVVVSLLPIELQYKDTGDYKGYRNRFGFSETLLLVSEDKLESYGDDLITIEEAVMHENYRVRALVNQLK